MINSIDNSSVYHHQILQNKCSILQRRLQYRFTAQSSHAIYIRLPKATEKHASKTVTCQDTQSDSSNRKTATKLPAVRLFSMCAMMLVCQDKHVRTSSLTWTDVSGQVY